MREPCSPLEHHILPLEVGFKRQIPHYYIIISLTKKIRTSSKLGSPHYTKVFHLGVKNHSTHNLPLEKMSDWNRTHSMPLESYQTLTKA